MLIKILYLPSVETPYQYLSFEANQIKNVTLNLLSSICWGTITLLFILLFFELEKKQKFYSKDIMVYWDHSVLGKIQADN